MTVFLALASIASVASGSPTVHPCEVDATRIGSPALASSQQCRVIRERRQKDVKQAPPQGKASND